MLLGSWPGRPAGGPRTLLSNCQKHTKGLQTLSGALENPVSPPTWDSSQVEASLSALRGLQGWVGDCWLGLPGHTHRQVLHFRWYCSYAQQGEGTTLLPQSPDPEMSPLQGLLELLGKQNQWGGEGAPQGPRASPPRRPAQPPLLLPAGMGAEVA